MLTDKTILLIIGGGIAAFRSLEVMRRLRDRGARVTPVLTASAEHFVTPLSVAALSASKVYRDLFDLTDEAEMGHIELSRASDLILVCPATANLMARMAQGLCDDLATTLLLATDTPVMIAPAMNVRMWEHPATARNLDILRGDGIHVVGPAEGAMACGEFGPGRLSEVPDIVAAVEAHFAAGGPLTGRHVLVTSGPTHEPIDPVRYIANRSSGAQGTAIAAALRDLGAQVTFITGPADVPPPPGVEVHRVQTAREMLAAVQSTLPADIAVMAAAVADWHVTNAGDAKFKKDITGAAPALTFAENPDILATVAQGDLRPRLVVGFAAETDAVTANATAKRARKGCDWIVANDVSPATGIMGGTENAVTLITADGSEDWPRLTKDETARRLARRIAEAFA